MWIATSAMCDPDRKFGETSIVGDCAMLETGTFMISSFGFAYCPTREPPAFEHLGGGLYKYVYD